MAQQDDIYTGFVEEVESYIPIIRNGIGELRVHPDNKPVVNEIHRLVHIVRGAAGMLGIGGLAQLAASLETALEHVQKDEMLLNSAVFSALNRSVNTIEQYCQLIRTGGPFDDPSLQATVDQICAHVSAIPVTPRKEEKPSFQATTPSGIDLDEELLESFNEEANEHFDEISHAMIKLFELVTAAVPVEGEINELVRGIRRSVHTVKGASAVIGMQHIADVGHRIEDVLDWLFEKAESIDPDILEVLGQLLDQLENLVRNPEGYDANLVEQGLALLQEGMEAAPEKQGRGYAAQGEAVEEPETSSMSASLFSEEEMQMLREGFMEEADEHLQELSQALLALEADVQQPIPMDESHREQVRTIRRAVHTIKGASAVIGINDISSYAHKVEDFLDWLFEEAQTIRPETIELLAEALDLLTAVIEDPASVASSRREEMFARLSQFSEDDAWEIDSAFLPAGTVQDGIEAETEVDQAGTEGASQVSAAAPEEAVQPGPDELDPEKELFDDEADLFSQEAELLQDADDLLASDFADETAALEDWLTAEPEVEVDPSELSELELAVMRQTFADDAEVHMEELHQSVQFLEGKVVEDMQFDGEAAEEIAQMRDHALTIRKGALTLGNGDVSAYARMIADFLLWLQDDSPLASPALINVLGDAIDVLGQLIENPDMVSWDRVEGVCQNLDAAKLAASKNEAFVLPEIGPEPVVELDPDAANFWKDAQQETESPAADSAEVEKDADSIEQIPETPQAEQASKAAPAPKPSAPAPVAATAADAAKTIRIHQNQLDTLINLANELLVGVSGFDQNMGLFKTALEELDLTVRRLKDIALELETKFEVKALDQLSFHFDRIEQVRQEIEVDSEFSDFDSMELDRYTQLNLIIRSLNESTIDVAAIHANMEGIHSGLGGDINRQHRVVRELQVQMMRARLSPMSTLTPRLSRTMRDVASKLRKRVRLVMEGDAVELDRIIWEKLADPFMHLVRNSVHHGIETQEERAAAGKADIATIRITGQREGNHVLVQYSDDGRGLNLDAIRERARHNMGEAADRLDERQLIDLIFSPGFSTQKEINQISGRGVGMDVVKQNVQELQGSITVTSQPGEGTQFTIRVPLTLGVVRALLVELEDVTYGVALNDILDIHRVELEEIAEDQQTFVHAGEDLPLYSLSLLLGQQESDEEKQDQHPLIFTTDVQGNRAGIQIPRIAGQKEVVLKGLGSHLRTVTGIAGAAVMGDGSVIPLLNMTELIAAYQQQIQPEVEVVEPVKAKTLTIMIVDDSISIRRVMSRLVLNHGWIPVEAKDGQDAFEKLDTVKPDCILLDIEMPRMNGFEFLTIKGNLPDHKDIPVIMLTSRSSDKHRNKAMELGASVFLNKPTKDEDFVDAVLRLTGHRRIGEHERQRETSL